MSQEEQTIPVVDLDRYVSGNEKDRESFSQNIGEALCDLGFVAIEGHGVDQDLIYETYDLFEEFFTLDEETKQQYEFPEEGRQRGYTSFGVEQAKDNEKPDLKEFWHLGRELSENDEMSDRIPANVWPSEVPRLKEVALTLYQQMEQSAEVMLQAISRFLDQPENFLPDMVRGGNSIIRVIHYPVCDGFDEPGQMRAAEHEDIDLITLLPEATDSGLQLLNRDNEWVDIKSIPGQMIVDSGDMLSRITNDRIPATTHRVVNPEGEPESRYSMPFFVHPHPDYELEVLDSCVLEGDSPKYDPIVAEDFLFQRLREIGVSS